MSDRHGTGEPGGEQIGGVAEEAAKLMGALAGWARDHGSEVGHGLGQGLGQGLGDLAGHAAAAARQVDEHVATGAPECTWCPVCRTIHTVRTLNPEVRQHLGVAASALVQAAAGLLASAMADQRGARREPDLERIDLEDEWPEGEWPEDEGPEDPWPANGAPPDGDPTNDEPDGGAPEHEGPGD